MNYKGNHSIVATDPAVFANGGYQVPLQLLPGHLAVQVSDQEVDARHGGPGLDPWGGKQPPLLLLLLLLPAGLQLTGLHQGRGGPGKIKKRGLE